MSNFIWVRDINKTQHYVNVNHIIRVTKVLKEHYLLLIDGIILHLSNDPAVGYDTYDEIIAKIRHTEQYS
jgi:hypothetical protein